MTGEAPTWQQSSGELWWLQRGERVVWQGGPDPSITFSKEDAFLVPFSLLWGGFAIFWEVGVSASGWNLGTVWGVPFVLIGLYMIVGRFFYKRWDRRRTRYYLTDRRAVVVRSNGRAVADSLIGSAPMQVTRSRDGRHGSVVWGSGPSGGPGASRGWPFGGTTGSARLGGNGWPMTGRMTGGELAFLDVVDLDRLMSALDSVRVTTPQAPGPQYPPPLAPYLPTPTSATAPGVGRAWGRWPAPFASGLLLLVGMGVSVGTGVLAVHRLTPYLDHPPTMITPGSIRVSLEPGTYVVFEHPLGVGTCYGSQCYVFGPAAVRVLDRSGAHVPVGADTTTDRMTRDNLTYPGFVEFHIAHRGSYLIEVTASRPARAIMDPSPGQEVHTFAGWIALGVGGLVLALAAGVCLVGALVHRRRVVV